jgi:hypothetical protein
MQQQRDRCTDNVKTADAQQAKMINNYGKSKQLSPKNIRIRTNYDNQQSVNTKLAAMMDKFYVL